LNKSEIILLKKSFCFLSIFGTKSPVFFKSKFSQKFCVYVVRLALLWFKIFSFKQLCKKQRNKRKNISSEKKFAPIHFLNKHSLQFLPVNEQKIDNLNQKKIFFYRGVIMEILLLIELIKKCKNYASG
jgi:hypothetical protein